MCAGSQPRRQAARMSGSGSQCSCATRQMPVAILAMADQRNSIPKSPQKSSGKGSGKLSTISTVRTLTYTIRRRAATRSSGCSNQWFGSFSMPLRRSVTILYRSMNHSSGVRPLTTYSWALGGMPARRMCSLIMSSARSRLSEKCMARLPSRK